MNGMAFNSAGLGCLQSLAAIAAIRTPSKREEIPLNFGTLGIVEDGIEAWIEPALNDPCTPGIPRVLSADNVRQLYKAAL
jgi:alcohol dehydrogenase class IV